MHPKSNYDFKLLKEELDAWVQSETIRIKSSNLSDEDKMLALQELLHKEISLLQTIEKLKISANKENRTEKIAKFLEKMSADKKWKVYDGHFVSVQTVLTLTAAKLERQFKKLVSATTVDKRLANLLEFKKLMDNKEISLKNYLIGLLKEKRTDINEKERNIEKALKQSENQLDRDRNRLRNNILLFWTLE